MPQYLFEHPKTNEIIEITQSIHDQHKYTDESGIITL